MGPLNHSDGLQRNVNLHQNIPGVRSQILGPAVPHPVASSPPSSPLLPRWVSMLRAAVLGRSVSAWVNPALYMQIPFIPHPERNWQSMRVIDRHEDVSIHIWLWLFICLCVSTEWLRIKLKMRDEDPEVIIRNSPLRGSVCVAVYLSVCVCVCCSSLQCEDEG